MHLQPDLSPSAPTVGPETYLVLFSAAALLILLIACINYIDLAMAPFGASGALILAPHVVYQ